MTYAEYLAQVQMTLSQYGHGPEAWRMGQTYFNVLAKHRPDLSEQVRGNFKLDPFYNDDKIDTFLEWVCTHWGNV